VGIRNVITRRRAAVVGAVVLLGTTIAVPVAALVARLNTIPLGPGTATITWTGRAGLRPTLTSIRGTVHGYKVIGSGQVPGIGSSSSGGAEGGGSIPSTVTLAKVNGQLGGSAFTLTIDLSLPNARGAFGASRSTPDSSRRASSPSSWTSAEPSEHTT
jgi:hypothetical protein